MAFWFVVAGIVCCIKAITYLSDMGDVLKALEALEQLGLSVAKGKFKIYLELVFIIALAINFFVLAYMAYKWKNEKIKKADKKEIIMPQGTFYMD